MSLCKWSCFCLLGGLLFIGWPLQVNCEILKVGNPPSKVKECRVHIEKALEQYWDQKDSSEESNTKEATQDTKEDTTTPVKTSEKDTTDSNYEGDDEEENSEDADTENIDNSDDDDDDENDDDDDEEEDDDNTESAEIESEEVEEEEDEEEEEEAEDDEDESTEEDDDDESSDVDAKTTDSEDLSNEPIESNVLQSDSESEKKITTTPTEQSDNNNNQSSDSLKEDVAPEVEDDEEEDETDEEESEDEEANEEDDEEEEEEEEVESESNESQRNEDVTNKISHDSETETSKDQIEADAQKTTEPINEPEESKEQLNVSSSETKEQLKSESVESGSAREDDDSIENIYEEEDEEEPGSPFRSREHIDVILGLDEVASEPEEKLAQAVFRDIKKIETSHIRPMEQLYKFADSTSRVLGDAEIFNKPMLLFLGPWSTGKTSIINYILGLERTPAALKTGTGITDVDFTLLTYGAQQRVISGTELAADWRYAGLQKFGQGFLDHFRSIHIPHALLQKVTIIDSPGIVESKKNLDRGYSLNDAFQWFIDRADAIYVVLDPSKVDIGSELGSVIEQLQGRDVRFLLNKADTIRRSDLMRVVGQLFWNLSPLMTGTDAPLIYAVSLTSHPYHPSAPAKFLTDQEKNFFYDIKDTLEKKVENKILYARKHAVRVRNHAKMVDCYLASYYRQKSIFSSKRNVAKLITENPMEYSIYDGLSSMSNVSRHDLPNPLRYKEFFKLHPLYDFKPLASTCSYFRGCPIDKLDLAIAKEFPELLAKYKDAKRSLQEELGKVR